MAGLTDDVERRTLRRVQVVYVDRGTAKWWNSNRKAGDVATFCGFYWVAGQREAGPFKTRSAAIRDAYYAVLMGTDAPRIGVGIAREERAVTKRKPKSYEARVH